MNKYVRFFVIFALFIAGVFVPGKNVYAASCTGGQSCWDMDPALTTRTRYINGQWVTHYCSYGAYTVVYSYGLTINGSYGQVNVELRYSSWCSTKWTRGTIYVSNGAKQLGLSATPSTSCKQCGYYTTDFQYNSGGLPVGYQRYTNMINGVASTAEAGLLNVLCYGRQDSKGRWTGYPYGSGAGQCPYNPYATYTG
jgi:hypothetical protein